MSRTRTNADVAVVGGGLVGISCALALTQLGLKVVLLNKKQIPAPVSTNHDDADFDNRIYTITPGNMEWLRTLGALADVESKRISTIDEMHIWGDEDAGQREPTLEFQAYGTNSAHLAYVVEERLILQALYQAAHRQGIDIVEGDCVGMESGEHRIRFQVSDGNWTEAGLLVAADGKNSRIRELAGISVQTQNYGQTGVVANFETQMPHGNTARQWFLKNGILAWLPLPGNRISMVWSTKDANYLLGLEPEELARVVSEAGAEVMGAFKPLTAAAGFSLARQTADTFIGQRLALLGDAAHQVHPLAGQGVNLGFRDAVALVDVLKARKPFKDIGSHAVLRRYERARKKDVTTMGHMTHGLNLLFASDQPALEKIRNWGMRAVQHQALLKHHLIKQAIL